jgi:DNA-binding MarR family transcriptional regulator
LLQQFVEESRNMSLNGRLTLLPPDAQQIGDSLAIHMEEDRIVFSNAAGPIFSCRAEDRASIRVAAVTIVQNGWAKQSAVAKALSLHRSTISRDLGRFESCGVEGLVEKRRGPKKPHTLTPQVRRKAQKLLDEGASIRATAADIGMSDRGLRHAIERGLVQRRDASVEITTKEENSGVEEVVPLIGPRERALEDQNCQSGVATKRETERGLARVGAIGEAAPQFQAVEGVACAGTLIALPALLEEGLLEVGTSVYGELKSGFFGLQSILLTFAFMALQRIKTPEQLTEHAPGELGILLGLDRAPEVKTLRRKLRELGERQLAGTFTRRLAERWAASAPRELALLYVDGHVRPYHGRKHQLPRHHVQQRGRPMRGTKDFYVNDRRSDPLLFVTAEGTESLLETLDSVLLPEVRRLVGDSRRVTIAFDREGWSPKLFAKWKSMGFDVLTYRKGPQPQWRTGFEKLAGQVGGENVEYCLAERRVRLSSGLEVREIRRRTDDGHQTAVITTNEKLPLLAVAHRMFSRWRQENFFRYMRQEFAIDHLSTNAVEPADPDRLVSNPKRTELEKERDAARAVRRKLLDRSLESGPGQTVRVGKHRVDDENVLGLFEKYDAEIERLTARIEKLPKRVAVRDVLEAHEIVRLERERKILVDTIKLIAYRAESSLSRIIEPFFNRHEEEARKLLKSIFRATADLIPDREEKRLTVRFHGLANPRATRALRDLCSLMNDDPPLYPGTDLRLHFDAETLQE